MNFRIFVFISCFIIISCYLIQQYYYTPKLPFGDDLPTIFDFLLHFKNSNSLSEKLHIIFNNHFLEHRLLLLSLITLLIHYVSGTVPLPIFTVVAGIFWSSLLAHYYKSFKNTFLSVEWLLPITCVLLSSASYQAMYWPMAALQHFLVIFFVFVATNFLCLEKNVYKFSFFAAIIAAILATFSSGNGMAVWPTGLLVLLVRKEFKLIVAWMVCMALAVYTYFLDFSLIGSPSDNIIRTLSHDGFEKIIIFLAGLGNAFQFKEGSYFFENTDMPFSLRYPSIYVGLLSVIVFIWMLRACINSLNLNTLSTLGISTFIFISFALIVLGRHTDSNNITTFKSRYCPYSTISISNTLYLIAVGSKLTKWHIQLRRLCVLSGVVFWSAWQILSFHKVINHNNMLQAGFYNWQHNRKWVMYQQTAFYENYYNKTFDRMGKMKFPFQILSTPLSDAFDHKQITKADFASNMNLKVQQINKKLVVYALDEYAKPLKSLDQGYALVMINKKDTFLIWSTVNRPSVRSLLLKGQICGTGYLIESTLDRQTMPKGVYSLYQFRYLNSKGFISQNNFGTVHL